MSFKCGIVGLPNVGKSTLFNALTNSSKAQAANFPFCTIDPNVGVVPVPDERLNNLSRVSKSKKALAFSAIIHCSALLYLIPSFSNILTFEIKKPNIYANKTLTAIAWRMDWLLSLLTGNKRKFTKILAQSAHDTTTVSNKKIIEKIGFTFEIKEQYIIPE